MRGFGEREILERCRCQAANAHLLIVSACSPTCAFLPCGPLVCRSCAACLLSTTRLFLQTYTSSRRKYFIQLSMFQIRARVLDCWIHRLPLPPCCFFLHRRSPHATCHRRGVRDGWSGRQQSCQWPGWWWRLAGLGFLGW